LGMDSREMLTVHPHDAAWTVMSRRIEEMVAPPWPRRMADARPVAGRMTRRSVWSSRRVSATRYDSPTGTRIPSRIPRRYAAGLGEALTGVRSDGCGACDGTGAFTTPPTPEQAPA